MSKSTPAQKFVSVREIRDGIAILNDGSMRSIIIASSINFALKSTDEQRAILAHFQGFLNSIDFSLQIYVQSRELDIRPYLAQLKERESLQDNDLMRTQLHEYMGFIENFTKEVDIMTKNFFVVIPYSPTVNVKGGITSLFKRGAKSAEMDPARFEEYRTQIEQRISIVAQGLNRIGVRTAALGTEEMTELFYHIYHPNAQNSAMQQ